MEGTTLRLPSTPPTTKSHPTLPNLTHASANADQSSDSCTPTTPASSGRRVHTPVRPDWAIAAQDEGAEAELREKKMRRHSYEHPDWDVAPDAGEEAVSEGGQTKLARLGRRGEGEEQETDCWHSR